MVVPHPQGQLVGKVALITGAGRNIGRAIALRFAREGADVVINARSNAHEADAVANEVRAVGRRALTCIADVGRPEGTAALTDGALAEFGRVDVLVNCAAIRPHTPFLELDDSLWDDVRRVVLDGAIQCTKALLPSMIAQRSGSVLFIAGEGAWAGGAHRAHIGAVKMGLIGLCRSLATEFGPHGVRFNVVAPGRIDTTRQAGSPMPAPLDVESIPLGRLGHVDDIANACLFLAGEQASFITGQTLHVNGGQSYH